MFLYGNHEIDKHGSGNSDYLEEGISAFKET